jgi:Tol biopolymer transport system component
MKNRDFLGAISATLVELSVLVNGIADPAQLVSARDPTIAPAASANGDSGLPIVSPDGRFVLFASSANDLPVMTNGAAMPALIAPRLNVFLRDRSNATTTLVSVNLAGTGGGNGDSLPAGLSTNGRYALIESAASDLFADDTNSASDVFVRDLVAGTNTLVSVSTNGGVGNGASRSAVMTPDGRYVAFVSAANNLVAGDNNGIPDVFLRDLQAGTTTLVSTGATTAFTSSEAPEITPDGRYVAFYSSATNLVPGVTNRGDIYVRDVVTGTTVWASRSARTALLLVQNATNALCFGPSLSADGQFVAYEAIPALGSASTPPPAIPLPGTGVILRYNLDTGLTDIVNTKAVVPAVGTEDARNPVMTPDGRFVAFVANANGGTTTNTCILVWDALTDTSILASEDLAGNAPTDSICVWPTITLDGRFVAFLSTATNLVTNALVGEYHLYLRDLQEETTTLMDADTNGVGLEDGPMSFVRLSDDGRFGAFAAPDGGRVAGDNNHALDVFMRDVASNVTELISRREPTLPFVTPHGFSLLSSMAVSADGRYIAFASDADDLVANDTNGFRDVFVRDRVTGTNILVSVATDGTSPGNNFSSEPSISADGRYVAFSSSASNLVAGDTNGLQDIFVRDLLAGSTMCVGGATSSYSIKLLSASPTLSADGHAVSFLSGGGTPPYWQVFWRDLSTNTTYMVSPIGSSISQLPTAMTPDGHYVAWASPYSTTFSNVLYVWGSQSHSQVYSTNLPGTFNNLSISPDGNRIACPANNWRLYLVDRVASTTVQLTTDVSRSPKFSADGRYLAYQTVSANVPGDTNGLADIYLYDIQTSSNYLVSRGFSGAANGSSDSPDVSPDGRFVAFRSAASNIVPNDVNGVPDVFVWDRLTGATLLLSVSRSTNAPADNRSLTPVFSGDGQTLAFASAASDLVAGDFNRCNDVFAYSLVSTGSIPVFRVAIVPGTTPAQGCWLTWPVIAGRSYRVQFKNSLADVDWQDLSGGVTIIGSQGFLNDLAPASGQRFYRIVAQ